MHENECPYRGAKPGYKFCKTCNKELQLENYNVSNARYDNLNSQCKLCTREYHRRWAMNILSNS
jgi:hypothetical protein